MIDPTSDRAMYQQIADDLREAILSGRLADGARVPAGVSPVNRTDGS